MILAAATGLLTSMGPFWALVLDREGMQRVKESFLVKQVDGAEEIAS